MLRINHVQRAALRDEQGRQFERRMYTQLRGGCSPPTVGGSSDEELRNLIRVGVSDAAAYGITREYDVRRFLEHLTIRGRSFLNAAPASAILENRQLSGTRKMDLIDELELFTEAP
jgi:hypothetical protein